MYGNRAGQAAWTECHVHLACAHSARAVHLALSLPAWFCSSSGHRYSTFAGASACPLLLDREAEARASIATSAEVILGRSIN